MKEPKLLSELKAETEKCVRCGTCRSICPTFRVIGRETASARGKLSLIRAYREGEIGLTENYLRHIKECTLCGGCRDACPSGVDTVEVFQAARADAVAREGLPFAASFVLKNMLDYTTLSARALKFVTRFKGLVFKDSATEHGLLSRFSLPLIGNNRLVPELADTFFLDLPEVKRLAANPGTGRAGGAGAERAGKKTARVAFYAGCGVNFLMPNVGVASIKAVQKTDSEVVVPPGQVCCGMPAFYMGDVETARALAFKNLEAFEAVEADYIATSCATCSHGLKNVFRKLLSSEDPALEKRVDAFCSRVRDITELLAGELRFEGGGKGRDRQVVTYHDPCHLNRNQGIRSQPRELLKGTADLEFREMKFPCSCCGLGGGLSLFNYDLSMEIAERKAESIRATGADVVATACPGCIVQLRDALHRYGVRAKVAHVVELL
ncbi:MAG TPA: (Fe-S)-binding protein [Thermodesulfobacteriota bacterium]|nr:(Fe-S)-binding protein [Thermodesulfobacteriota bacterium]